MKKKIFLLWAFSAMLSAQVLSTPKTQLTGKIYNPDGTGFTGFLYLSIEQSVAIDPGYSCGGPAQEVPSQSLVITLANGVMTSYTVQGSAKVTAGAPKVFGSDCTIPRGVPYIAKLIDPQGNTKYDTEWLITGTTQDIGTVYQAPQPVPINSVTEIAGVGAPSGVCSASTEYLQTDATPGANIWKCPAGAWIQEVGGGSSSSSSSTSINSVVLTGDATGTGTPDSAGVVTVAASLSSNGVLAGTYPKVSVDGTGRVTAGFSLAASDVPNIGIAQVTGLAAALQNIAATASGFISNYSPAFTGIPTTPTPSLTDNSNQIANTQWVKEQNYGTVTAVTVASVPSRMTAVVANPTTTPAITITDTTQTANTVFAGPSSGTAAVPTFRALAEADITGLVADLVLKAPLASPALTGTPTAPTPGTTAPVNEVATVGWVQSQFTAAAAANPCSSDPDDCGAILLQHNGINNVSQTKLNLKSGTNINLTDDGVGGILLSVGSTPTSPSQVQYLAPGEFNSTSGTLTFAASFPASVTKGNLIVLPLFVREWANGSANPTITDNFGDTYTQVMKTANVQHSGADYWSVYLYTTTPSSTGALTISVTQTDFFNNEGVYFSGFELANVSGIDVYTSALQAPLALGPMTTTQASDMLYAVAFQSSGTNSFSNSLAWPQFYTGVTTDSFTTTTWSTSSASPASYSNTITSSPGCGVACIGFMFAAKGNGLVLGNGTVQSVAMTVPNILTVSGSPITSSGTFALGLANENANTVFAGPSSGTAAAPSFRALAVGDLPALAESNITGLVSDLALKAPLASPSFTGTPSTPTPATSDSSTTVANTAWVKSLGFLSSVSGTAGGDLSGTYPNPAVVQVNGGAIPTSSAYVGTNSTGQIIAATTPLTSLTGDATNSGSTVTLAAVGTAGTYTKVTTDSKGRVTAGTTLIASDIPALAESQITNLSTDLASKASATQPYDIPSIFIGQPPASQVLLLLTIARPVSFAANFAGSTGSVGTNPAATATFTVLKNGTSIGTASISTGGVVTFTTSGGAAQSFVAGDVLEVTAPATQDTTLANVSITLVGSR